jgi:Phage integrase family
VLKNLFGRIAFAVGCFQEPPATNSRDRDESGFLFPIHDPIDDLQPWSVSREPNLSPEHAVHRQKMLADIANSYLATSEQRVAHILQKFPETRDSDTALCIRYWKMFQADVLERWQTLELEVLYELDRIETIGRLRRMIQNQLRLFRGVAETQRGREAMQSEFHEYIASHRDSLPEVRFYLDETGNEGHKTYTGIAGVCIINWKQFEKHYAALEQWRSNQGPETIHFSDTSENNLDRAVSLLQQLQSRRSGVLFLPKGRDQRAVPLCDPALALLRSLPHVGRWVFTAPPTSQYPQRDRQIDERRALYHLKKVLKNVDLEGHLHTFRHTVISYALASGTPEASVRKWAGHVDAQILKFYTHVADEDSKAHMVRLFPMPGSPSGEVKQEGAQQAGTSTTNKQELGPDAEPSSK